MPNSIDKVAGAVAQRVERWTCDQPVQILLGAKLRNNLGQVVHTYAPLVTKQYNLVPSKGR